MRVGNEVSNKVRTEVRVKGQVFLIIAILFVLFLVILRSGLSIQQISENQRVLEENLDRLEFDNIRSEFANALLVSFNSTVNMTNNTINFTRYIQLVEQSKGLGIKAFSVQAAFNNTTASTDMTLNVTVFTLVGEELSYLNLSFTNATPAAQKTFSNIPDNTTLFTFFNFNTDSAANYTLYIFWNTTTRNETDSFTIPVEIAKSKYIGYFDIELIGKRTNHRDKFIHTFIVTQA